MEVCCNICGKKYELTKIHKDYLRLAREPKATFICQQCSNLVRSQAKEDCKPKKPM